MKKIDPKNVNIEYFHSINTYYRIVRTKQPNYLPFKLNITKINKETAMNWVKKGAKYKEYNRMSDFWKEK